jgi:all-trans-retinol dehydrogenase (NAD+)
VEKCLTSIKQVIGRNIDILVNNAGIVHGKILTDLTASEIEKTFRVNTLAHFWTVKAVLPSMLERNEGLIVTMASMVHNPSSIFNLM